MSHEELPWKQQRKSSFDIQAGDIPKYHMTDNKKVYVTQTQGVRVRDESN